MNNKKRVLVIDDEPGILKVLSIQLKLHNYEIVTANDGSKAIELVNKHKPDIVLLDLLMPGISGLDVLRDLKDRAHVPVIAFSANPKMVEKAMSLGANGSIAKPFNPAQLIEKIESILKGQQMQGN